VYYDESLRRKDILIMEKSGKREQEGGEKGSGGEKGQAVRPHY
jgi:hypothetical protein